MDMKLYLEQQIESAVKKALESSLISQPIVEETKGKIKLFGIRNGAAYVGCAPSTFQKLKNSGKVPFYEVGKRVFFFSDEIDEALKCKKGGKL
ncbi:hypothetical protein H8788_23370 [Parabacteroides faecis]|nr:MULTISPECIES: hypothetical protein [Parabacteroides]MBC8620677.1 hypothetical protein [Parabacteroides faecis]RHR93414.1 hypothetical protein DWW23_21590 [Parabacteroides sp. AF14-59]GGK11599.1 hypothetical protein GCM10007084_38660 [Parabacteroides faecis]